MKKIFAAFFITAFLFQLNFAQTIIPGGNVSGTWTLQNSPYTVQGNVTIPVLNTLTIEAGVNVIVQGNYSFMIKGIINAVGTSDAPIYFSKHVPGTGWEGLHFENASMGSELTHCIFQYGNASGGFPENVGGAIYITGNSPIIRNCTFRHNVASFGGAIFSIAASPLIEKCVFYGNSSGNHGGAIVLKGGNPEVFNCTFYDNSADGGGAIYLEFCDADIQNSIFFMNEGYGAIYLDEYCDDAQIKYCDFYGNTNGTATGYKPSGFGVINAQNNNADPCDIYYNIFLDPLFADYGNDDFNLTINSPCRNAGNPDFVNDPDGTLPDIGAFYFPSQLSQTLEIPGGWSGISSFVIPSNSDIEEVLSPIMNELSIIYSNDGTYWPQGGINTLQNWNSEKGYVIKTDAPVSLTIEGDFLPITTLSLYSGWNILPVLTDCEITVEQIHTSLGDNLVVIQEIAGTNLFWPNAGITTLQAIVPGKAYRIYVLTDTNFTLPSCE